MCSSGISDFNVEIQLRQTGSILSRVGQAAFHNGWMRSEDELTRQTSPYAILESEHVSYDLHLLHSLTSMQRARKQIRTCTEYTRWKFRDARTLLIAGKAS